ncbi:MAG: hypothetical protein JO064_09970 [Actinobacteria bacterium]|nr:hypothetical protein [Actinomycetota bacterium]
MRVVLLLALVLAPVAHASEPLSDTNLANVKLAVDAKGEALITYTRANGQLRRVLVWGAVNALPPSQTTPQVHFQFDYSGGWKTYHRHYWTTFADVCRPYSGPPLVDLVVACTAPDGTNWAIQSWQRSLPLLGFAPWNAAQSAYEFEVSHWSGDLPQLTVAQHYTYNASAVGLFGQLTYRGQPVYGFRATATGNPYDRYSRNVYIDTHDSAYGAGWARESGILLHAPNGTFCHSFVPQHPFPGYPSQTMRPPAPGDEYRATVEGPGVTPVVQWEADAIPVVAVDSPDEQGTQERAAALWSQFMTQDMKCAPEAA